MSNRSSLALVIWSSPTVFAPTTRERSSFLTTVLIASKFSTILESFCVKLVGREPQTTSLGLESITLAKSSFLITTLDLFGLSDHPPLVSGFLQHHRLQSRRAVAECCWIKSKTRTGSLHVWILITSSMLSVSMLPWWTMALLFWLQRTTAFTSIDFKGI